MKTRHIDIACECFCKVCGCKKCPERDTKCIEYREFRKMLEEYKDF